MQQLKASIADIFLAEGIGFTETSSGELCLDQCFNCGRPKKLYIHTDTGAFICFRCDSRGGPVKLLQGVLNVDFKTAFRMLFGKAKAQSLYEEDNEDLQVKISGIKRKRSKSKVELPRPMVKPHYMKPLKPSDVDAWNYLRNRGLTDEVINELGLLHWESANRIVLPVTIDGELYGTLSRDYIGNQEKKVLNSSGNWRSFTVWNFDNSRDSEDLILCEGAFSAIKCGIFRSVALLGKTATEGQIEVLRSTGAKRIYICLDIGTEDEQFKLFSQLAIYFPGQIYQVVLPPIKLVKCPICKKTTEFDERLGSKEFNCSNCEYSCSSKEDFIKIMKKAEYKDAGDYTFEEMDSFIKNAPPFRGGPTFW